MANIEFQLVPLPKRIPILYSDLYKDFHHAIGLDSMAEYSWGRVIEEKVPTMTHVFDFPYNGEPDHNPHGKPLDTGRAPFCPQSWWDP